MNKLLVVLGLVMLLLFERVTGTKAAYVYYGVHVVGYPLNLTNVSQFETDAKRKASIVMIYQGWGTSNNDPNFNPTMMDSIRSRGSIPMITWQPEDFITSQIQPTYSLLNIINGAFDSYITNYALAVKAWNHPIFIRFAHEMNGNWYPWSEQINGNSSGQYVQMWQHVHDIFTAQGVTNVTWAWTPMNTDENGQLGNLAHYYPGDAYVDWVGIDGYNWGTSQTWSHWQNFADIFYNAYYEIAGITQKPMMIGETASTEVGGNKATWISDTLQNFIPNMFPKIKALIWFNENKEQDWRIESSARSQTSFSRYINNGIYSTNLFGNISISPIQPL